MPTTETGTPKAAWACAMIVSTAVLVVRILMLQNRPVVPGESLGPITPASIAKLRREKSSMIFQPSRYPRLRHHEDRLGGDLPLIVDIATGSWRRGADRGPVRLLWKIAALSFQNSSTPRHNSAPSESHSPLDRPISSAPLFDAHMIGSRARGRSARWSVPLKPIRGVVCAHVIEESRHLNIVSRKSKLTRAGIIRQRRDR